MAVVIRTRATGTRPAGIGVTLEALRMAEAAGVGGDVRARLARMARRAAPLTHAKGNRRFDDYVLSVRNGVVVAVGRLDGP